MALQEKFSSVIAGTMTWGVWGRNFSTTEMEQMIHHCVDLDITSFDHADIYGDYTTEAAFGKALKQANLSRDKIQLISKCGIQLPNAVRNNSVKRYDYSKEYIIQSVEQSLIHFNTEYLDLLLLHRPSPLMQADEIAMAVNTLKEQGKIIDFGVSNFTPSQTDWIQTAIEVQYNQIEFSLTQCHAMTDGSLDHMQTHQIRPMSWAPLGKVFNETNERSIRISETAAVIAKKYEANIASILLSWIIKHPARIIPVFGTTDKERIQQMKKASEISLCDEDWFELWTASMGHPVP